MREPAARSVGAAAAAAAIDFSISRWTSRPQTRHENDHRAVRDDGGRRRRRAATEPSATTAADDADAPLCRYCFSGEEDGPLISPCACKGGQKFVHVECLRKWQRAVIVTQPTHPALYRRDERQETCNVCKAKFDPPPPSRAVLMAGFTGEEVAGLLHAGCLIVCERRTSRHMATLLRDRGVGSLRHWVRGVYLITATHEGRATDDNDLIVAVNLTREVQPSLLPSSLRQMAQRVAQGRSGGFEMFGEPPSDDDEDEMEAERRRGRRHRRPG